MAKYLVTGGAGFIGSNSVEKLLELGHDVRVVDNLSTGKFDNIKHHIKEIDFICGDLSDMKIAKSSVEGIEYIIHLAAIPSVSRSIEDPISTNQSIVTATLNLFNAAKEEKSVNRIVQAVSSSAYGDTLVLPKKEDMVPNPLSPYAVAKLTQEYYAKAFYNVFGLEVLSLRYFNIFGKKQDPFSFYSAVIPKFITQMLKGERPTIFGDGTISRDFTYIDNVVDANLKAITCKWPGHSEVINIGCGERITLNELISNLNIILKTNLEPIYGEPKVGDVKHSLADIKKAREILGYDVIVEVNEGLALLCEYLKNN